MRHQKRGCFKAKTMRFVRCSGKIAWILQIRARLRAQHDRQRCPSGSNTGAQHPVLDQQRHSRTLCRPNCARPRIGSTSSSLKPTGSSTCCARRPKPQSPSYSPKPTPSSTGRTVRRTSASRGLSTRAPTHSPSPTARDLDLVRVRRAHRFQGPRCAWLGYPPTPHNSPD
jgi:hypothetical protein